MLLRGRSPTSKNLETDLNAFEVDDATFTHVVTTSLATSEAQEICRLSERVSKLESLVQHLCCEATQRNRNDTASSTKTESTAVPNASPPTLLQSLHASQDWSIDSVKLMHSPTTDADDSAHSLELARELLSMERLALAVGQFPRQFTPQAVAHASRVTESSGRGKLGNSGCPHPRPSLRVRQADGEDHSTGPISRSITHSVGLDYRADQLDELQPENIHDARTVVARERTVISPKRIQQCFANSSALGSGGSFDFVKPLIAAL